MFKLIGEIVVVYILYQIIFNFIVPLYKASKQMKGTFNDIQSKMKEQQDAHQRQYKKPEEVKKRPTQTAAGDYIDYEEVKE
jgi:type III secretory pathway component EscU